MQLVVGQRCKKQGIPAARAPPMNERMCIFEVQCSLIGTYFAGSRHCVLCGFNKGRGSQSPSSPARGQGSAVSFPAGSGAAPQPKSNLVHFSVKFHIWWQQLELFS